MMGATTLSITTFILVPVLEYKNTTLGTNDSLTLLVVMLSVIILSLEYFLLLC
jgi:hypothetical protein